MGRNMENIKSGISIREGRNNKQYINTNFDFIDALNRYADCETLGFYISFKRYINRKDNTKENQVTYTQAYLQKQFNIGRTKYYRHLKTLFNIGLCDVEKLVKVKFYVNYNLEGNPLVEKSIVYFSTLEDIDIPLKNNLENVISEHYPEIPSELIKIVEVNNYTNKVNNIIKLNNNINELPNNIINQSIKSFDEKEEINKNKKDRLIDIDQKIRDKGLITYDNLVYNLRLEKQFFEYPISEWIDPFKKALWEMYYYDYTRIRGKEIPQFDIINKLQKLNIDMVTSTIEKVIESSRNQEIQYPIAFLKTAIFNEIDEFSAKIQAKVNYDLNDNKNKAKAEEKRRTRFHNFESRTDGYSAEELEAIARRKREEVYASYSKKIPSTSRILPNKNIISNVTN